jgi:hypothetical protein
VLRDELDDFFCPLDDELCCTAELLNVAELEDSMVAVSDDDRYSIVVVEDEAMLSGAVEDVVSLQAESIAVYAIATNRGFAAIARSTLWLSFCIYEPH